MIDDTTTTIEVTKLPGVADLPLKVRGYFAKALIAERDGKPADAERFLQQAIDNEQAILNNTPSH